MPTALEYLLLIPAIALPLLVGFLGSIGMKDVIASKWYTELKKPTFQPPSWMFGVAWTILYILMGIASWFVWISPPSILRTVALVWYIIQLALNALWSPLFFKWHKIVAANILIFCLILAVLQTGVLFLRISTPAGLLLVPYILWLIFASALNTKISLLNR